MRYFSAIVFNEETSKLYIDEVEEEEINDNEVKVRIKATAINRADLLQRMGLYPPPEGESDILGLENGRVCDGSRTKC